MSEILNEAMQTFIYYYFFKIFFLMSLSLQDKTITIDLKTQASSWRCSSSLCELLSATLKICFRLSANVSYAEFITKICSL